MSCYKELLEDNQELRCQVLEISMGVRGLQEQIKDSDWTSTQELEIALNAIPIELPWD